MSVDAQSPSYEIGHFEVSAEVLKKEPVKYIVQLIKHDMRYVLHADQGEGVHVGVRFRAGIENEDVIGGGNIGVSPGGFVLQGYSQRYKREPNDVRAALQELVRARLANIESSVE